MKQLYLGGKYNCTLLTKDDIPYSLQSEAFGELRLIRVSETMYATKEVHIHTTEVCMNCHVVLFVHEGNMTVELGMGLEAMEYQFQPICQMDVQAIGNVCFSAMVKSAMKYGEKKVLIGRTIIPGERSMDELIENMELGGSIEAQIKETYGVEKEVKVVNPCEFVYFVLGTVIQFWRVGKIGKKGCGIEQIDVIPNTNYLQIGSNCYEFVAKDGYYRLEPWKQKGDTK